MVPNDTVCRATPKLLDVLIVGGGLSGMMVAHDIHNVLQPQTPLSWRLLEARKELGGRLKNDEKFNEIDLGGAWIWPPHQPFMKGLVSKLSIPTFLQPDDRSSTRIVGGAVQFVHQLAQRVPQDRIELNTPVTNCTRVEKDGETIIQVDTKSSESFLARKVVFAVPPRLLSEKVKFDPPLSPEKRSAMSASQTWMAGVTKVSLVFENRFWRLDASNLGLPRHTGPAFQVYDASTKDGSIAALTFFTVVPPTSPAMTDDELLARQCAEQMGTLWKQFRLDEQAKKIKTYTEFHIHRWPNEEYLSEDPKPTTVNPHPYPVAALSQAEWDGTLLFAGTETDRGSPGVMEGAVSAANRVVNDLKEFAKKLAAIKK